MVVYEPKLIEWNSRCSERLEKGQREYNDQSFFQPTEKLIAEISEELMDVANWAFLAWCRLQETLAKVRRIGTP